MKKILYSFLCSVLCVVAVKAQTTTVIAPGTTVIGTGASVVQSAGTFTNNGSYTDTTSPGRLTMDGGVQMLGTGAKLHDLSFTSPGLSLISTLTNVYNTATVAAGATVQAGFGNLWLRTDIPTHTNTANLVVHGVLNGSVQGIMMFTTATIGACPYPTTMTINVSGSVTRYRWESSPDNITWTPVPGATNATYPALIHRADYYHCVISTTNSTFNHTTFSIYHGVLGPPVAITGPALVCPGGATTLSNTTPGGTWSTGNANATVGLTSGIVIGVAAGTSTISYTLPTGCFDTAVVTINPLPTIAPTNTSPVCAGGTVNFNATATAVGPITYSWTGPSLFTSTLATPSISGAAISNAGIYVVTATAPGGGCHATGVTNVVVSLIPGASPTNSGAICLGGTAVLFANPVLGTGVTSYSWTGPSGFTSTAAIVSVTPTVTSTYSLTVSGSGSSGCSSTVYTTTVPVNLPPTAITGTGFMCIGASSTLSSTPSGGAWSSNHPAIAVVGSSSGIVTGVTAGVATIVYKLSTGCYTTTTVTINGLPPAITGVANICAGGVATLANTITGGTWSSSSPSVAAIGSASGTYTGGIAGTATITYVLPTGCLTTTTVTVTGTPAPITGTMFSCPGGTMALSSAPGGGTWSSATPTVGSISVAGVVTGITAGTSNITYTIVPGCSVAAQITVNPFPATITGTLVMCVGNGTTLSCATSGGTWTSSSPSVAVVGSASGVVASGIAGVATITYTLPSGCFTNITVTVNPLPSSITGTGAYCVSGTGVLSSTPIGGSWSSSNSTIATIVPALGIVTGILSGTAVITYTLTTGCYTTRVITINPLPAAVGGTTAICEGATTTMANSTSGGTWSSSNPAVATIGPSTGFVNGLTAGTTNMIYTLPTGCYSSITLTVNTTPTTITGTSVYCAGNSASLASTPSGGSWSSSNTTTATISGSGVVSALSAGTTTIIYSFTTGCQTTKVITVNPSPAAITGITTVCVTGTTTLANAASSGAWSSSSPAIATIGAATGIVSGLTTGTTTITYTLPTGCFSTMAVTVIALPAAITGSFVLCPAGSTTLSSATPGGMWNSSDPSISTIGSSTGTLTAIAAGTATISYTISGAGCVATQLITVNPSVAPITGTFAICSTATTMLSNATIGGSWSSSTPAVATIGSLTGLVTSVTPGITTISYTTPGVGCAATQLHTVNPLPASISGVATVCAGLTTTLTSATTGGTWSSGSTSIAAVGSSTGIVTGIASGSTNITYTLPTGCISILPVTVNPLPGSITGGMAVCVGASITLVSIPIGGTWSSSSSSTASVGSGTGVVSGLVPGTTTITYMLPTGCIITTAITVNPLPAMITGVLEACPLNSSTLSNATPGGAWSSSTPTVAVAWPTGLIMGVMAGTSSISYTLPTGCTSTAVFTVNPLPAAITGTGTLCVGSTTVLSSFSTGGAWSSSTPGIASVSSGVVTGVSAGTATITYTLPTGCYVTTIVTVNPLPSAIGGPMDVCTGSTITLYSLTPGGIWTSSNPLLATIGSTTGTVMGMGAGNPVITYTLPTGCLTTTTITVNPTPTTITGTLNVCVGSAIMLASTPSGGAWSSSNPSIASAGPGTGIINGLAAGTITITYMLATGCNKTTSFTVNPLPAAIAGSSAVCVGSTTVLTNSVAGGTWSSSNPSVAAIGSLSGIVTGGIAGTTTITYTLGTGCLIVRVITVNPLPAAISGTATVCVGSTTTLTNSMTGGAWSSSNASLATVGSTGIVTGISAGAPTITYTLATGCFITRVITVNPLPAAIAGTMRVCVGATTTLTNTTSGGIWTSSNTSLATVGSTTGLISGLAVGNPILTYTLPTGCSATVTITVNLTPAAISGVSSVCVGSTIILTNTTSGGVWSSSNPSIAFAGSAGVVTGLTAGTSVISYTLPTGCSSYHAITVNPLPAPISGVATVCVGSTTVLTNSTAGGTWSSTNTGLATVGFTTGIVSGAGAGNPTIIYTLPTGCTSSIIITVNPLPTTFTGVLNVCVGSMTTLSSTPLIGTWSSSNPAQATVALGVGLVTGVSAGTSDITYTLPTGCIRVASVTVNPLPFLITGTMTVCAGLTTTLVSGTIGGSWSSSSGMATVTPSGIVTGVAAGNPVITYTLPTGCFTTTVITVNPSPTTITGTLNVCVGSTTILASSPTAGTWSSSNPAQATVSGLGLVTGMSAGNPTITYTLPAGCTVVATLTVNPLPTSIAGATNICVGVSTTLSSTPTGGSWSSSSTSLATVISATGVVTGAGAGSPTITYTLPTGCRIFTPITVNPNPAAISGTPVVCAGSSITLGMTTPGGTWSSSNPGVATVGTVSGIVTGVLAGNATISYTLATGCFTTVIVTVNPVPSSITGIRNVCIGLFTSLASAPTGGVWSCSDIFIATVGSTGIVTGVSAGIATISYSLSTGCFATAIVTINPLPAVIGGSSTICVGSTTLLTNTTTGGTWTSSNSNASVAAATGVVTGNTAGISIITYTLPTGCIMTKSITVNPLPSTIGGTFVVCAGLTTALTNSGGGTWSSSNPTVATIGSTGVVTGVNAGTATITYALATGCLTTSVVTVNPLPSAITGTLNVCVGSSTALTNATGGGTWSSSNATIASVDASSGIVTGGTAGTATITYTLVTGCLATAIVTVNPLPATIGGITNVCVGLTTTLTNATVGGTWTSSNTSIANVGASTGIVTGVAAGTTTIMYTIGTGCFITTNYTVNPLPATISGTRVVCVGSTTALTSTPGGGTWSSSNTSLAMVGSTGIVTGMGAGTPVITYTLPTGCISISMITVNTTPATISGTTVICAGSSATLASTPSGGTWTSSNYSVASLGTAPGAIVGVSAGTATITYTLTTGCFVTATVTVNPLPASITGTLNVCAGSTTTLTDTSGGGTWTSGNPTVASVISTGVVTGASAGTSIITYALPTGCRVTAVVTVNPLPAAITGIANICVGSTTTLINTTAGGAWTSSSTALATVSTTGVVAGASAGNPIITYTLATGCFTTYPLTVNPLPAAISGVTNVCVGLITTLSNTTTGGTWSSGNPGQATVSSTGDVTGISAGTANITYALSTGCRVTSTVTVNPNPSVITGTLNVCVGTTVSLSSAPSGGSWSSSNTAIATVIGGFAAGINPGTATITYSLVTGCRSTAIITVNPLPASITGAGTICAGQTLALSISATGGTWSSSNTSQAVVSVSGLVTSIGAGVPVISYTLPTGCSATQTITINPLPLAITGPSVVCVGAVITMASASGTSAWSSNNTGIAAVGATSGIVSGVAAGTTTISFTLPTGCYMTKGVTVNPLSVVYTVIGGGSYCFGGSGMAIGLANSQSGVSYQLYRGATAVGSPVSGTGSAISFGLQTTAGTYMVVATVVGTGCRIDMSGSATIAVNALPTAYTVTGGGTYCAVGTGITIGLSGSQIGVNYQLYHGTTALGAPVSGTGIVISFGLQTLAGIYTAVATNITTACTNNMIGSGNIVVNPAPAVFTVTGGGALCSGGTGVSVGLSSSVAGISYQLYVGTAPIAAAVMGTGSVLSFGLQTIAGTYTVVARNPTTLCTSVMTGSATVVVNTTPAAYSLTGGGNYCTGGSGVTIGLSGSQAGMSYQLYTGTTPVGSAVSGTGAAISFGTHTSAGTYTAVASNSSATCTRTMSGSATITISILPATFTVTGGGTACSGGSGIAVGLSGSQSGVSYRLYRGTVLVATTLGTGAVINFGLQSISGTYTVVAVGLASGCTANMSGAATVTINSRPVVYTVTGGGSYCVGGSGMAIGLSNSAIGVDYQLYRGGTPVGSFVSGTGAAISFGLHTATGSYIVIATDAVSGCTSTMLGGAVVSTSALPTAYTVIGGGSYCAGGTGLVVRLSGSATGINYQLYLDGTAVGSPIAGTGTSISFGTKTAAGVYTVVATHSITGCASSMSGSVTITINPSPTAQSVTGGGSFCSGGTGVTIGLSSSQSGVNYQLKRGAILVGGALSGTGSALSFGLLTVAGTYSVTAVYTATGCTNNMTGTVVITVNPLPSVYTVTGGGSFCSSGSGVAVGLSGSTAGISYQLYRSGTAVGSPISGTGSGISFGLQTIAGTYTVVATNATTTCTSSMVGSATVSIVTAPGAYTVSGGGPYCSGAGYRIYLSGSSTGVTYRLSLGSTPIGSPVAGTGLPFDFGLHTAIGTYTVVATGGTTSCTTSMTGSASITSGSLPTLYFVTGGGTMCAGSAGYSINLSGSQTGINYQLYRGTFTIGSPVAGTGAAISFGAYTTAGGYTVVAVNGTSGCIRSMSGSATIIVQSLPTAYTVTGGGSLCFGGSGVPVGLSGSASGVSYKLYRGTALISTVAGTGAALSFGTHTIAGIYTITATNTATTCAVSMSGSATVVVNPLPSITGSIFTVAPALSITLSGSASGGTWSSSSTTIATVGSSSGVVTGVSLGSSTINYTLSTGCRATRTVSVTPTGHRDAHESIADMEVSVSGWNVAVMPNPNKGTFAIRGTLSVAEDVEVVFEMTNVLGQSIYRHMVIATEGKLDELVQLKGIANGMYLLNMRSDVGRKVFHIIVEQ